MRYLMIVFAVLALSATANAELPYNGNRVISITTIYEDRINTAPVESCEDATPLIFIGAVAGLLESMIPDDAKEILKFKTSFHDVQRKYDGRPAFAAEYEIIGHVKPFTYKIIFSALDAKNNLIFKVENISGSLLDEGETRTQKEIVSGICSSIQEVRKKSNLTEETTIESEIREFSKREYPNDSRMQKYTYKKQMAAYNYKDWPLTHLCP